MSFVRSITAKLGNDGTKMLLQEVGQESCWWNRVCQILILILWIVTPPCFLAKIAQILQNVIAFFPERGEEIKLWFWNIWIALCWSFSAVLVILFHFDHLQEEKVGQSWTKSVALLVRHLKKLESFKKFSNNDFVC